MSAVKWLRALLVFIAAFHLVAGAGLMFSVSFQQFAVTAYGGSLEWTDRNIYFLRIVGSFAFVLGYLAAMASADPLKHSIVVIGFIEFFVLRNIHRHLYSNELYAGFAVAPLVNDLTTAFFGVQAVLLAVFLWRASRHPARRKAYNLRCSHVGVEKPWTCRDRRRGNCGSFQSSSQSCSARSCRSALAGRLRVRHP